MGCNIFNNCDILQEKLDEYMESNNDFDLTSSTLSTLSTLSIPSISSIPSIPSTSIPTKIDKDEIILVEFNDDCISFTVSNDEINYIFKPSKNIEIIKNTWFEEETLEIPKQILYKNLSKISESRKNFHEPEYFKNKLKKVYFKYINNELVPFRYSLRK